MISHDLLPSPSYNRLPVGDGQTLPDTVLNELGKIIVRHGMQGQLGVGRLHRHFDLNAREVMVHKGLRCSPQTTDDGATLGGSAFYLDDNQFRAFEYDAEEAIEPPESFLSDLATYVTSSGLAGRVALSKLDSKYAHLEETFYSIHSGTENPDKTIEGETRSHVCAIVSDGEELRQDEATMWGFGTSDDGQVRPFIAKMCKRTDNGSHKRTK
ncbi:hypothetical protein F5Y09DRAFT_347625 [Xylaria sp. FL1042]|nr:hypothetical protein F5Y09DRAFT_347625 [Xylaria sp. FL1042]